jgi:hypothetical protein
MLKRGEVVKLVKAVAETRETEIGCDECFQRLDRFAEAELSGLDATAAMPLVAITSTSARTVVARSRRSEGPCAVRRRWVPREPTSILVGQTREVTMRCPGLIPHNLGLSWTGLQHLDLVAHPDHAGLYHPCAGTATTL